MSGGRRKYQFYGPAHFRSTWEKFLEITHRDGQSGSEKIRIWVENYVHRKDPGNPQPPITAWVPGHEDQKALTLKAHVEIEDRIREHFQVRGPDVCYRDIVQHCKRDIDDVKAALAMAQRVAQWLRGRGVKIWW